MTEIATNKTDQDASQRIGRRGCRCAAAHLPSALLAFSLSLACFVTGTARAWDAEWLDASGRLVRLPAEGGWVDCKSEVAVASADWQSVAYLSGVTNQQSIIGSSGAVWRAQLSPEAGVTCQVMQVVHALSNGVEFAISATAAQSNACAGVFFILHLPAARFAGGQVVAAGQLLRIPVVRAMPYVIGRVPGGAVMLQAPGDNGSIRLRTPTNVTLLVQDNRRWSDEFACIVPLVLGPLAPGQTVTATLTATGAGHARTPPMEVDLDTAHVRYRFDGFGGNYCYGLQGALAHTVFNTIRPAWARVQMRLDELKRPRSTRDAEHAFLQQLAVADKTGSELQMGLAFQALLATNHVPCLMSLWRAPAWMYTDGEAQQSGNVLRDDAWPYLAAAATAYLRYARDHGGVEPEAFSINEPNYGASIVVAATNYAASVRLLGDAFRRAGLRTRLVLGDVSNARDAALAYLEPVLADPVALGQVGWVGFHSWGGATPDEYAAWGALADRLRLPLVVAEAGVDPEWVHAPIQRHDYAMSELAQYFALLTQARPQVVLLWEHTDNYPILVRDADRRLLTTARWGFQKQWCGYSPRGSLAVGCDLLVGEQSGACAFTHGENGAGLTLHLGNWDGMRVCHINGLPPALTSLNVIQTTRDHHAQPAGIVRPHEGELRLELPAESMTTLTTLTPEVLPE